MTGNLYDKDWSPFMVAISTPELVLEASVLYIDLRVGRKRVHDFIEYIFIYSI